MSDVRRASFFLERAQYDQSGEREDEEANAGRDERDHSSPTPAGLRLLKAVGQADE